MNILNAGIILGLMALPYMDRNPLMTPRARRVARMTFTIFMVVWIVLTLIGFAFRGVEYGAEVETAAEPQVRLTAELGKLPFTMEIGEGRYLIRRILNASLRVPHGRIALSAGDDMRLEAVSVPPEPFTPASLMATLAALLFDFQPYLELLGRVLNGAQPCAGTDKPADGAGAA